MTLVKRLATLVKADAHGVVDSLEDRRLQLRQSLREAELELDRKRARLEALGAEASRLGKARARAEERLAALDADVELALEGGEEELARFAIRKLLPLRAEAEHLVRALGQVEEERQALASRLAEQETELKELKVRVRAQLARGEESESLTGPEAGEAGEPHVAEQDVELELLRRRQVVKGGE